MNKSDKYITISEAAQILGVTPVTLRNWEKLNKIDSKRDPQNHYRLYSLSKISALLQKKEPSFTNEYGNAKELPNNNKSRVIDTREFKLIIRQMSKAFRDSHGGSLLERFEEISKLLYCKLYDEKNTKTNEKFASKNGESQEETYKRISDIYSQAINLLQQKLILGRDRLTDDKKAVVKIVEILQGIYLNKIPSDVKGVVFEELIKNTFDKTENQQFFTPRTIVKFMVELMDPSGDLTILDPACGSGGFLIQASNYINHKSDNRHFKGRLIGLEIDKRMAWITQMNLLMHGDGKGEAHHLLDGGSLAYSQEIDRILPNNKADLIITNPPFGSDFDDLPQLKKYELGKGKKSRRRGVLFIERCLKWLKPGGRLALIIDDSVLNSSSNKDVREHILGNTVVEAIVSLPEVSFMPYATAKASILILKKRNKFDNSQGPVFMAESENVGRKPNGDPLYSGETDEEGLPQLINDLPDILKAWKLYQTDGKSAIERLSPKIFICPAENFLKSGVDKRIDIQYHHPAKYIAEEVINKSAYPTPKLIELVTLRNVSTIPNVQDPDDIWRYVGLANITPKTDEYFVSEVMGNQIKSAVKLFKSGDILISKLRPELRKCVLINQDDSDGYVSSECLVLSVNNELNSKWKVDPQYLAIVLRSDIIFGQLIYQVTGVGRPRVGLSTILNLKIPLPPMEIQKQIVSAYNSASIKYFEYKKRSTELLEQAENSIKQIYEFTTKMLQS